MSERDDAHHARLEALHAYLRAQPGSNAVLERLTEMAARVFDVPMACVTLIGEDTVWIQAGHGLTWDCLPREPGLCNSTLALGTIHHLPDASTDPESREHAAVRAGVRFYAGAPLSTREGHTLGTFCLMGREPRGLEEGERKTLADFARLSMNELERARAESELASAQSAIRDSEARFRAIFEQAAVGIGQVSLAGVWTQVNARMCEITGYSEAELREKSFDDLSHPDEPPAFSAVRSRGRESEAGTKAIRRRWVSKDGREVWVILTVSSVCDAESSPSSLVVVVQDATEAKETRDALQRMEQGLQHVQKLESLGVMAGGIAHDFNNLLVGILGNAGLALSELPADSPQREALESIENAAMRASELSSQMLAYSGKGTVSVGAVDLCSMVREMTELLTVAMGKLVTVEYELSSQPVIVQADVTQLRQVLMNLVTNASEAIGQRAGTVRIAVGVMEATREYLASTYVDDGLPPDTYAFLEVMDTGTGMDEETRERIFDPFFTTKVTGRGLGLASVIGIVRGHRGAIAIDSNVGRGSTFRVVLPRSNAPEPTAELRRPKPTAWRGEGKILVVDDEPLVLSFTTRLLENAGFEVLTALDGEAGVLAFREHASEVRGVVLDVHMPRKDGETAGREMRAIRGRVPIVFSSGYEQEGLESGAGDPPEYFIKKPYTPEMLIETLRSALED